MCVKQDMSWLQERRLAKQLWELADCAHQPVLYISKTKPWITICKLRLAQAGPQALNYSLNDLSWLQESRLAKQLWEFADCAHQPVLYISKNKTVNYNMQTPIGASRATSIELSVNDELVFIVYRIGLMRFTRTRVTYNGSAVWLGAVCVRVGEFFASPGKWTKVVLSR
jgi:hypothetical protein